MRQLLRALPWLCVLVLVAVPASAQSVCAANCEIIRGEPFTAAWDLNSAAGGPATEYRLYMALQGGTAAVVARVTAGSPQIVNDVVNFQNPQGTTAPAGTYTLVLASANASIETRSDPLTIIVRDAPGPIQPPAKPTGGRISKP